MGNDSGKPKKPKNTLTARKKPITIDDLAVVGVKPADATAVTIAQSERDNYVKSLAAHKRATERPLLTEVEKLRQVKVFAQHYKTVYKKLGGERVRWQVTTTPLFPEKEVKCLYRNVFTEDGELDAVGNYHADPGSVQHEEQVFDYEKDLKVANSTVFWCQRRFLLEQDLTPAPLRALTRREVSNVQTQDTARVCLLLSCDPRTFPADWSYYWDVDERNAACSSALLGTPNGIGALYLFRDWGAELGLKGMEYVEVTKPGPQDVRQVDLMIAFTR